MSELADTFEIIKPNASIHGEGNSIGYNLGKVEGHDLGEWRETRFGCGSDVICDENGLGV